MKVKELAAELQLTGKEVLEKAKAMGVPVSKISDELSEIDAKAVRNTIARSQSTAETKVVRAKARKADGDKTAAAKAPAKETKHATIAMPEAKPRTTKKATIAMPTQTAPKQTKPAAAATKPAAVKPAVRRTKPASDEPKVSKAMLEERIAREKEAAAKAKAEAKAAALAEEEAKAAAKEAPADEKEPKAAEVPETAPAETPAAETKPAAEEPAEKAAPAAEPEEQKPAAEESAPEAEKPEAAPEEKPAEAKEEKPAEEEKPKTRSRLKVVKRAEEVHREEAIAAEKRKARREEGARRPSAERRTGERRPSERRPEGRPEGRRPASGASRPTRRPDAPPASGASKSSAHGRKGRERDRDKDRDKFARLEGRGKKSGKPEPKSLEKQTRAKRHSKPKAVAEPEVEVMDLPAGTILINVPITVAGFAEQTKTSVSQIIMTLMKMGVMANVNQNLDEDTVVLLAEEMNISIAIGNVNKEEDYEVEDGIENFEDAEKDLKPRAPIITVMGHVDHGKTSLLDAIRKTNVTDQESGGITQHIGASEVEINGQKIVFLDTPGHEAFTAMRARGAHATDIAVLVVAADDSVKPQTIESISHAKSAGVPIIVAINKMDKPGANPDIVKKDLADQGVLVEDWGGEVISVPVSAKTGEGIRSLLEMILLQAEVLELKANPDRLALGTVLEARLDKAKGPIASLLVLNGTLKSGMSIVAGTCAGKIRLMTNSKGEKLRKAGPATAVEILGLTEVPQAGDVFNAVKSPSKAKEIAYNRQQKVREEIMARNSSTTLEELFSQIQAGEAKELNLIIKADVQGSVGAIVSSLEKLSTDEVKVNVVHTGVGTINESDVMLAGTSDSVIIGFNVRPSAAVSAQAERDGVQIRTYNVIYNIIDDVGNAMKGMLDPEFKEVVLGSVEIRTTFKVPGVGIVGGAYVTDGKVVRNEQIRLVRDGIVIHEGKISSLKRFKDDAKEVTQGYECGIGIENYNDIKEGDVIECFTMEEIERA
ncbi:MAG: translation initiation factor IF-2 [Firmicutes bacterium]|nr:translation initiation factor IF-2 [Bacillota bacterium]